MSARSASERISFGYGGICPLELRTKTLNASSGIGFGASVLPAAPPCPTSPWHCQQPFFMKAALPLAASAASAGVVARPRRSNTLSGKRIGLSLARLGPHVEERGRPGLHHLDRFTQRRGEL